MVDIATRYPFIVPLRDKTGISVANAVMNDVCSHLGMPKRFISDVGSEFSNSVFHSYFLRKGVAHYVVAPENSRANGIVERLNGSIRPLIDFTQQRWPMCWKEKLYAVLIALRNRPHRALDGYTPAQLMFGMTPRSLHCGEWMHDFEPEPEKSPAKRYSDLQEITTHLEKYTQQKRDDKTQIERVKAILRKPYVQRLAPGARVNAAIKSPRPGKPNHHDSFRGEVLARSGATSFWVQFEELDGEKRQPRSIPQHKLTLLPLTETQEGGVSTAAQ